MADSASGAACGGAGLAQQPSHFWPLKGGTPQWLFRPCPCTCDGLIWPILCTFKTTTGLPNSGILRSWGVQSNLWRGRSGP